MRDLAAEFSTLEPGGRLVYHVGFLARDRDAIGHGVNPFNVRIIDKVARDAYDLAIKNDHDAYVIKAHLVQRKLGNELYEYQLVKRRAI